MLAFVYPGQGTQRVGMAAQLLRSSGGREIFTALSDRVGVDLAKLCLRGPDAQLTDTRYAQPAIFAADVAAHVRLEEQGVRPDVVAGHSVGELTALWAAGAIDFDTAAALVVRRAELMASAPGEGAMAACNGLSRDDVDDLCQFYAGVVVGLHNSPEDVVISGPVAAVDALMPRLRDAGARRVDRLRASHAFHSPLMTSALLPWADEVAAARIVAPTLPVYLNVSGRRSQDQAEIRSAMVGQLVETVEWATTIDALAHDGVQCMIECGESRTLASLAKRCQPNLRVIGHLGAERADARALA